MKKKSIVGLFCLLAVICTQASYAATDKVAVLITGWGMPVGYNFDYAWTTSDYPRIGDKTDPENPNDPCKIGHVGELPYQSHINMIPWAITYETEGMEEFFDYHGIYIYNADNDSFRSPNPAIASVDNASIPDGVPRTPLSKVKDQYGTITYPLDPRDNTTDYLDGWYRIGSFTNQFPNGISQYCSSKHI